MALHKYFHITFT